MFSAKTVNYGFIRQTSLQNLLRNSGKVVAASIDDENPLRPGDILQDFFTDKRRMHGTFQTRVMGPSLSLRVGERHTVGIVTACAAARAAYRVPGSLAYGALDRVPFGTNLTAKPFHMGGMAWAEIGILYALRSEEGSPITMSFGVVPKFLAGFEGFTARSRETFTFRQPTADSLELTPAIGFTASPLPMPTRTARPAHKSTALRGLGIDLGFSMSMPAEDSKDDHDYLWRVGASLTDFGLVRFRKGGADTYEVQFQQTVGVQSDDFMDAQKSTICSTTRAARSSATRPSHWFPMSSRLPRPPRCPCRPTTAWCRWSCRGLVGTAVARADQCPAPPEHVGGGAPF